ncbi:MAG TPA: BadF/BadG/BcrA/BcrD ATPase family protein [Microvirga sp.]|jgi:glucosamine kinase|nr:BadF/BadG/BcrA/BcrD ATPase family protein [Microvirga sp.]
MTQNLFIGIDGGGTGCRARIRDGEGRLLGEGVGGPANIRLGSEGAWASILAACRSALAASGLADEALSRARAGLGLAGAAQPQAVAGMLAHSHPFRSVAIETDAHIAWLGAFGGGEGAILIVGTGSVGYGVLGGRPVYIGGRGFQISDDGSGAVLGRELLRRTIWAHDGRAPMTSLASAVLERFGGDPETMVDWSNAARPRDYASFAPLIVEHATAGDPLGSALVSEAADAISGIARRLVDLGAPRLCLFGGLSRPLMPWFAPDVRQLLAEPLADALDGAVMLARAGHEPH